MPKEIKINAAEFVGSLCISSDDGQKLFDKLKPLLKENNKIILNFEGVEILISLFLNVAIGQLYGQFSKDVIESSIKVQGLSNSDLQILERVKENALRYYNNPEPYDEAWQELEEDDE
ncbi:STAS-like domain-containing protein [Sedimentisphaera salicampi]|uniref:DUF4325 domain-containing protein n=1 Tax=Sedimentisphaera salicampi TaxID=1941349 RepID=A0A1W6LKP5_9BACT|nr:STAS-like domain-containing protein [Sedimentisphaera salicampi]ARN56347.1 hypothetical protein STSP1_00727 [Sedimentisphaera salicampi]